MRNTDILVKLGPILTNLNSKQKRIALDIIQSSEYSFLEYGGTICVKTTDGVYGFVDFVKSKCNCN